MSVKFVSEMFHHRKVPMKLRNVLLALCDSADDRGYCHPSISYIAWKVECSERTVSRSLAQLESLGVINVKQRYKQSSIYRIDLSALPEKHPYHRDINAEYEEFEAELLARQNGMAESGEEFSGDNLSENQDNHDTDCDKRDAECASDGDQNHQRAVSEPSGNTTPHTPQGGQGASDADASATKKARTKPGELTPDQEARFERWWQIYPRKEDKAVARKAWKRCDPDDAQTDAMIVAVGRQAVAKDWADPSRRKFIPLPSTWLNGARWEDEVDTATTAGDPDLNLDPTPTNAARLGKARARAEFRAAPYLASQGKPLTAEQEARIRAGTPLREVMTAEQRACASKGFEELVSWHRNKIAMSF